MTDYIINKAIIYTIDLKGAAIVNTKDSNSIFLEYPEAAVWLIFVEGHELKKSGRMLEAILGKGEAEIKEYTKQCINNWKAIGLIE